ncbi:MAG: FKBP-type peptidyl-prolyl cis-trans isomerase SlyD [Parasphingorhabdus sp.]|jgi:FKBP-type peptidyl-prolyl cis-trans isomerase SlyD
MKIEKNSVVEFDYRLSDDDGNVVEDTADSEPMAYLHGHGGIIPGLEKHMEGHEVGDAFKVRITPEEGYGYRDEGRVQRIPMKHLITKGKLKPGQVAGVNTPDGPRQIVVLKVGRFVVDADLNHPFAGLTLNFDINVVNVRESTAEEVSHGHAHGPGGHDH